MGVEGHPLLPYPPQAGQGEHLEAAAVGEDGLVPAGEPVEPPQLPDDPVPGADVKVVGVAELHLAPQFLQVKGGDAPLDGGAGGNVHKGRGLDSAVDGGKLPPPGSALLF